MKGQRTQDISRKKQKVDEKEIVEKGRLKRNEDEKGASEIKGEEAEEEKVRNEGGEAKGNSSVIYIPQHKQHYQTAGADNIVLSLVIR